MNCEKPHHIGLLILIISFFLFIFIISISIYKVYFLYIGHLKFKFMICSMVNYFKQTRITSTFCRPFTSVFRYKNKLDIYL